MASPLKIPPSISNATPEQLQKLLVQTLQKLKARDKKIEELSALAESNKANADSQSANHGPSVSEKELEELAAKVSLLNDQAAVNEKLFQQQLTTQEEQFGSQLAQANGEIRSLSHKLAGEQQAARTAQEQLAQKQALVDELQQQLEEARQQHANEVAAYREREAAAVGKVASPSSPQQQQQEDKGPDTPTASQHPTQNPSFDDERSALEAQLEAAQDRIKATEAAWSERLAALQKDQGAIKGNLAALAGAAQTLLKSLEAGAGPEAAPATDTEEALKQMLSAPLANGNGSISSGSEVQALQEGCRALGQHLVAIQKQHVAGWQHRQDKLNQKNEQLAELINKLKEAETARAALETQLKESTSTQQQQQQGDGIDAVKELEAARAEVAQIRKEADLERIRVKKAVTELRKRVDALQKEKQRLEQSAAEEHARLTTESDALRVTSTEHAQRAQVAEQRAEQLESELRDYKLRAHSLLKAKETQIKQAKDAAMQDLADELAQAQVQVAAAEEARHKAEKELDQVRSSLQQELATAQNSHSERGVELMKEASAAKEAAEAAKRQYEHLQLRYDSLETRTLQLQTQMSESQTRVNAAEEAKQQAEQALEEHKAQRQAATEAAQFRANELASLAEANSSLRAELASMKRQLEAAPAVASPRAAPLDKSNSSSKTQLTRELSMSGSAAVLNPDVDGVDATLAALAEKDRQLAAAQQRASELEREIDDLERESTLRQVQEAALKEAVRELERELERVKLPDKQQDMEYFKNVMLKLFETGQDESLLPVVAKVLQFSPAELSRCKQALAKRQEQHAALLAGGAEGGVTGYLGSWLGLSGGAPAGVGG